MRDRNVQFPNRYRLEKVQGTDDIYDLMPAPGTVTEEGTLVNKSTLLKDVTAALYGLGTDAVPDDVLAKIKPLIDSNTALANSRAKIQVGSYVGTGTYGSSNPCSLTFDFVPKLLFVHGPSLMIYKVGAPQYYFSSDVTSGSSLHSSMLPENGNISVNDKTIAWYITSVSISYWGDAIAAQMNIQNETYYFAAIG